MISMTNLEEPFDFTKYRSKSIDRQPETVKPRPMLNENSEELAEPFDFKQFKVKPPLSTLDEFKRHTARTGARIAESIAGFPGDIVNFVKFLGDKLPDQPSFLKSEPNFVQKVGRKALESIPSSNDLKEFSSYLTSGFTDPKNAQEELADDVTSLATILINPSKAVSSFPQFLKTIGKSVARAGAVKGVGKGVELLGADEETKGYTEIGTLFLTGLMGGKTADKFVAEKYKEARNAIPQGTLLNSSNLDAALAKVDQQLAQGISTNTKNEVRSALNELKAKTVKGQIPAVELVESVHNINERINSKKLFDELKSSEKKQLKHRYDLLKKEVHKEIADYGKNNPDFYESWKTANEAYGTIAQSKKVSNFIQSKLGSIPHHLAGSLAIDLFLGNPAATLGVIGSYSAVKLGELMTRIAKSPGLRDHYMKVILEANNENLPATLKHLNALDKEAQKIQNESSSTKLKT